MKSFPLILSALCFPAACIYCQLTTLTGKVFKLRIDIQTSTSANTTMGPQVYSNTATIVTENTIKAVSAKEKELEARVIRFAGSKTVGMDSVAYDTDDGTSLYHPALNGYREFLNKVGYLTYSGQKVTEKGPAILDMIQQFTGNTGTKDEYGLLFLPLTPDLLHTGYEWSYKSEEGITKRVSNYRIQRQTDSTIEIEGNTAVTINGTTETTGGRMRTKTEGVVHVSAVYNKQTYQLKSALFTSQSQGKSELNHAETTYTNNGTRHYTVTDD